MNKDETDFEEDKIYTFSGRVEQTKYDNRFGKEKTLLFNLHTVNGEVRDHIWVCVKQRFKHFLKPYTDLIFTARVEYYIDIETGLKTKLGLRHIRNIRKGKLNDIK